LERGNYTNILKYYSTVDFRSAGGGARSQGPTSDPDWREVFTQIWLKVQYSRFSRYLRRARSQCPASDPDWREVNKYFKGTVQQIFTLPEAEPGAKVHHLIQIGLRGKLEKFKGTSVPGEFLMILPLKD
jgi:hypothetical protein